MMDMMLTGRTYGAEEGLAMGLSQYLVEDGAGLAKGIELAQRIAANTLLTNYAVMHVLPRIAARRVQQPARSRGPAMDAARFYRPSGAR